MSDCQPADHIIMPCETPPHVCRSGWCTGLGGVAAQPPLFTDARRAAEFAPRRARDGVEDMILITEKGCENQSAVVPAEVPDIEKLMAETGFAESERHESSPSSVSRPR
jgi:hypothetical protein